MDGSVALADSPAGCDLVVVGGGPVAVEDFPAVALASGEVGGLSADGCLTVLGWAAREKARLDATILRVQARFTECRPPLGDRDNGKDRGYSEFAVDEVAAELGMATGTARGEVELAVAVTSRLPATLTALEAGRIDLRRVKAVAEATGPLSDEQAAAVETRVLARGGRGSHAAFRQALRRAVLAVDPDGAEQRRRRQRRLRRVERQAGEDGLGELLAVLPAEHLTAIYDRVDGLARRAGGGPGDDRCMDERRADALVDLLLGSNYEHVQTEIHVTVPISSLLGLSDLPGELAGFGPIPAGLARELAERPQSTWRRMLLDPADGTVLEVGRRRFPSPALARYVAARDRRCRFPGCVRPATSCEIDHTVPHGRGGWTEKENLGPKCKHHHRLKDETNWHVDQVSPGVFLWTAPTGRTYLTVLELYDYENDAPPY
jgi:hypothetical protein